MNTYMKKYRTTIILFLIVLTLSLVISAVTSTQEVSASGGTILSSNCYYLNGNFSVTDGGEDEFPSSASTNYIEDTSNKALWHWIKIGISNGGTGSEINSAQNLISGTYRAKNVTITIQTQGSGKDDNQHLYSATLYKDGVAYKTADKSSNLKGGKKYTVFDCDNLPSGDYYVEILYSADKGWRSDAYGVGWIGFRYKSYSFTINNDPPSFLSAPDNNSIVKSIRLTVPSSCGNKIYLNGNSIGFTKYIGTSYSEGKYTYYAEDDQGNKTSEYTFYLDYTAPTGTLYGVSNGGITNGTVYFAQSTSKTGAGSTYKCCDSDTITIQYRKNSGSWTTYSNRQELSEEGNYYIKISDTAGNSTTYKFEIDKTAPSGTLDGVTNGGITNNNVSFTWADANATAKLDGNAYTKNSSISTEGRHTIVLTDTAGNSTTYKFEIDKTAPSGSLSGVTNGSITNKNVTFTWADTRATAKLDGNSYTKNSSITSEGKHTIVLTDTAENSTTYTFEIDKTAPTGTFSGLTNEEYMLSNGSVTFSWNDSRATAKLDGNSYTKNSSITSEGKHTIVLTDTAGNSTTYTFEIDKTAPLPAIYTSNGITVIDGNIVNKDVYFTWSDAGATAKFKLNSSDWQVYWQSYYCNRDIPAIKYETRTEALESITLIENNKVSEISSWNGTGNVYSEDTQYAEIGKKCWKYDDLYFFQESSLLSYKTNRINSLLQYVTKNLLSESGNYTIILTNRAGNSTTRIFTIDKTAPTGTLSGLTNEQYMLSNGSVTFSWDEDGATATLDGNPYSKGSPITDASRHTIVLTDRAGNSTTYTFEIDKTAPSGTLKGVANNGFTNGTVTFSWDEDGKPLLKRFAYYRC